MLFVPGSAERRFRIVDRLPGVAFILDLEDAVPRSEKEKARHMVAGLLAAAAGRAEIHVRVNPARSSGLDADLDAVVRPGLAGVVLPKVEGPDDVAEVAARIGDRERRAGMPGGGVRLMATVETAAGIDAVGHLASASPRLHRLCFGAGDFARDLGLDWPDPEGLSPTLVQAKVAVVLASRVGGLDRPHDGAYSRHRDLEGLRREADDARRLGFGGKHAIHPDQVAVIADAFRPSPGRLEQAARLVATFDAAVAAGEAAIEVDGEMVDEAIAGRARQLLADYDAESERPPG